jgi:hypothetical protein
MAMHVDFGQRPDRPAARAPGRDWAFGTYTHSASPSGRRRRGERRFDSKPPLHGRRCP